MRILRFFLLLSLTSSLFSCRQGEALLEDSTKPKYASLAGEPAAPVLPLQREFRAAWVATVANIDWPSQAGLTTEQQQNELITLLDRAAALHLNAIIFQVRPAADAFYNSPYEPWSPWLTGEMGQAPEPYYDPLEFAIREAHKRGLELHAWFNPFRAGHSSHTGTISDDHISVTHPHLVHRFGDFLWLDPGNPQARDHTLRVILDVVERYDIDAVHFDDYFYPYPSYAPGEDFPDSLSWQTAAEQQRALLREEWRRENINSLIRDLAEGIREIKPHVRFGISPFGVWRPGYPELTSGFDSYRELHADARLWLRNGWVDYLSPQIYFRMDQVAQPFPVMLNWWREENVKERHLWPGLYTSRLWTEGTRWEPSEITSQIYTARAFPGVTGVIHFSMKTFLQNSGEINRLLTSGPYALPAAVPGSPWLHEPLPLPPIFSVTGDDQQWGIRFYSDPDNLTRYRSLQIYRNGISETLLLPAHRAEIVFENHRRVMPDSLSLSALNQTGGTSRPVHYRFKKEPLRVPFSDPAILSRTTWGEEAPAGIPANAIRLRGALEETLRFEELSLTIHSMMRSMAFPDRLLKLDLGEVVDGDDYREVITLTLKRGEVSETVSLQPGDLLNWYGYTITLLTIDFQAEQASMELATTGSLSVARRAIGSAGDHRLRFRVPHSIHQLLFTRTPLNKRDSDLSDFSEWLRSALQQSLDELLLADLPHHFYISPEGVVYEGRDQERAGYLLGRMIPAGALLVRLPATPLDEPDSPAASAALQLTLNLMHHYGLGYGDLCMSDADENSCRPFCEGSACAKSNEEKLRIWLQSNQ